MVRRGNSQRLMALTMHASTAVPFRVELCTTAASTRPVGAMVNCVTTRPSSDGRLANAFW